MRGKDLLECMEYIDDALVEEAMNPPAVPHRNIIFARWGIAAACVVVIGASATALWSHQNVRYEHIDKAQAPIVAGSAADNARDAESGGDVSDGSVTDMTAMDGATSYTGGTQDSKATVDTRAAGTASDDTYRQSSVKEEELDKQTVAVSADQDDLVELAETETKKLEYTVISDYYGERDGSIYDYPVPEKGKVLCCHYLQETMRYYTNAENTIDTTDNAVYAYEVEIELYGDILAEDVGTSHGSLNTSDDMDAANGMIEQEYRRLSELGYAVRLSEDFQLTGTFTKTEIDTFQASPELGYIFGFADEW